MPLRSRARGWTARSCACVAVAILAAAACGAPGFRADKTDPPYTLEPYTPPPGRVALTTGELILECERHLRAWQEAMAAPRTAENQEAIAAIERALLAVVHREKNRLEEQATSGPPVNRAVASAALGFSNDAEVLPLLANNAADSHPAVRANALLGLGVLARPETPLRPIHTAAVDPASTSEVLRNAAFAALRLASVLQSDQGGDLGATFAALLGSADPAVRTQAALGAGIVRAAHLVPQLTDLLTGDPQPQVRMAAAVALGNIGAPGAAPALARALDDTDKLTRGAARAALVKIHGRDEGPTADDWRQVLGLKP